MRAERPKPHLDLGTINTNPQPEFDHERECGARLFRPMEDGEELVIKECLVYTA